MVARAELLGWFKELGLTVFSEQYEEIVGNGNASVEDILGTLCRMESERRYSSKVKRRIKEANFPNIKTLAMLDYSKAPGLPKQTISKLSTGDFIAQHENILLVGDSGGGKTHLAIALGIEACKQNYSVLFFNACHLVNTLVEQYDQGKIEKYLHKLKKTQLCIIDELGYIPFSKKGAELFFQVFSDRYESCATIVTSNLHFSRWGDIFGDKTMTTALLDRLTHHSTIVKYDWGSVRFNDTLIDQKNSQGEKSKMPES